MSRSNGDRSFALIGAAGYIAPRHMDAIKRVDGDLRVAFDPFDSVGIIDRYFPNAQFFVEFEKFAEFVYQQERMGEPVDYCSICSPNHLHQTHVSYALRSQMDAICEKPLVLCPADIDYLAELERSTGRRVNNILQLRLHPSIIDLRGKIEADKKNAIHDVDLTYITSRGRWYHSSWKGDEAKSGGVAMNIGVHFFDMLGFVFGAVKRNVVHFRSPDCAAGYLEYDKARVRWFLSIKDAATYGSNGPIRRSMTIRDVGTFDFSSGFEDLHAVSYREILAGRGFPLTDVRSSIEVVDHIRTASITPNAGEQHPLLGQVLPR